MAQSAATKKHVPRKTKLNLAERLARVEDIEAIRGIVAELNWDNDQQRIPRLLQNMTDDVLYRVGEFGEYRGKAAVSEFLKQIGSSFDMRVHHTSNHVVRIEGTNAVSLCYYLALLGWQGKSLIASGEYHDELVKGDGRWLIQARDTRITFLSDLKEGWTKQRILNIGQSVADS